MEQIGRLLQQHLVSAGANKAAAKLPAMLEKLTAAVDLMACTPVDDDPEQLPPCSFGKNLAEQRSHLHDDLGLSVLFIHDHLCKWHGMADTLPEVELLRCIARITQAPRRHGTRRGGREHLRASLHIAQRPSGQ